MALRTILATAVAACVLTTGTAFAQTAFPKSAYYVGLGDSVAAGTGALPATNGYVYRLYNEGVFGQIQDMAFSNAAVRAARSWELLTGQVPQVLCTEPEQRATVVTITAGANDVFRGDVDAFGIAQRVAQAVNYLFNNPSLPHPILDPTTGLPCRPLEGATILVSNYYSIPHPVPAVFQMLDALLRGFDQSLRFLLPQIPVPAGSRLAIVDLYTPSLGRQGLVTIERRDGFPGPGAFDFDPHPTNLGHAFIAKQFAEVWRDLQ